MWETEARITDAELEVMEVLWQGEDLTLAQVKEAVSARKGWSGDTVKTLLRRLLEKGAVGQEKRGVYHYRPLVSREALGDYKTSALIDKLYAGSAKDLDKLYAGSARQMVAALVERRQLDREDVAELRDLFDRLWEEKRGEET